MGERERDMIIGTPYYMSPEQVEGQITIDGRADIYALGATLYHMVTGRPPFHYKNTNDVLKAHLKEALTPPDHLVPDLSVGLGEVIETMMAKKPIKRYQRAGDLIHDLECLLNDRSPELLGQRGGQQSALEDLAAEEAEEEPEPEPEEDAEEDERDEESSKEETKRLIWKAALGSALVISVILNIILLVFRPQ
jgi:serine/threonine-protein kinase